MSERKVPKLRFPEFSSDWENMTLGHIATTKVTNSFSREKLNYKNGDVKNIHYGDIHKKFQTLFDIEKENVPFINPEIKLDKISGDNYCIEGDLVFADASEDLNDVGKSIEIVNINNEKLISGLHTILVRPQKNIFQKGFAGHLLKSNKVRLQIQKESQGSKVLSISGSRLLNTKFYLPCLEEQSRIADFLTSVDDKIQQLTKKKELLEHYKKGVMRDIFSQKIRFKDDNGNNYPDWRNKGFTEVINIFNGFAFSGSDSLQHGARWVKIADVGINEMKYDNFSYLPLVYLESHYKYKLEHGDYVIALTRPILNNRLKIARINNFFHNSLLNQRVGKLITNECKDYIFYLLQLDEVIKNINERILGSEPPNLSINLLSDINVEIPCTEEQTKIANFLISVDDKITQVNMQLEQTKLFKKSLLQQMFI